MTTRSTNAPKDTGCPAVYDFESTWQKVWNAYQDVCHLSEEALLEYQSIDFDKALKSKTDLTLSIVIPVFNERNTIGTVICKLAALPINKQIIIVDDCSTDGTDDVLNRLTGTDSIEVVRKTKNEGKGAALRTAFAHATGSFIVVQDADLEYDPKDIHKLLVPLIKDEADVVFGSRFLSECQTDGEPSEPHDKSWIHRMGNGVLTWTFNMVNGTELTDMETCYKAFRREVLDDLEIKQDRFGIEPELTAKLARRGFRFTEVPISYNARGWDEGKKIGLKDLFQAFYCIGRYGLCD